MLKRIEDWNYYELLSVERTASQDEIWEGYQSALATYRGGSLALYGLVSETERDAILGRIQEAFQTLRDPDKRKEYDLALLRRAPYFPPQAAFRKSVGKLEIEEAPARKTLWDRIKRLFVKNP
jgi:curved DNA-binding protein CbpA